MSRESEPGLFRVVFARVVAATMTPVANLRLNQARLRQRGVSRVIGWMHVALFAAFSCLAPGTMPELRAGGLTVVICTGAGLSTVTLDENGKPVEALHEPCVWSVHAQSADLATSRPPATTATFTDFKPEAARSFTPTRQDWADQNRSRGPPHIL